MEGTDVVEILHEQRNEDESNCVHCQRPDHDENMVQCDRCDKWQHYSCAGVDDSIADRSWVCATCDARRSHDDEGSVRSGSSRSSTTSAFSVCMSQLMNKQRAEKARVELALQRRHLEEQQRLIDSVLGEEAADVHGEGEFAEANRGPSSVHSTRRLTPSPGSHVAPATQQSVPSEDVAPPNTSIGPIKVSIPISALDPGTVRTLRAKKDPKMALLELRNRVEQCENRANPTSEQLADLHVQLETCRKLLEGFQAAAGGSNSDRRLPATNVQKVSLPQPTDSTPRVAKQAGAVPKKSLLLPVAPSKDQPLNNLGPMTEPATNTGWPVVSNAGAASEMHPNHTEPPGKSLALNSSYVNKHGHAPIYCPTTHKHDNTREQSRSDARPGTTHMPPIACEQQREPLARSGIMQPPLEHSQPNQYVNGEEPRDPLVPRVDFSLLPCQLGQQSQVIPHTVSNNVPTKQQLAARQSLAKELPHFSGDPEDWPIFISNYLYTTEACGFTNVENMVRLQRCLTGAALDMVRNRLVLPAAVPQVIETLRMRFGRPEVLINALLRKVREIPALKSDRLEGLIDFGVAVQALCDHIEAANERAHLSNPSLLQELVSKLPANQRMMWAGYKRGCQHVDLKTFGDYMASVVQDATSVVTYEPEAKRSIIRDRPKIRGFVNTHADNATNFRDCSSGSKEPPKRFDCAYCNNSGHRIRECNAFKELNVDDRWRRIRALQLCQNCLFSHGRRACRLKKICDIDGCQFRHHPLLHSPKGPSKSRVQVADNHTHHHSSASSLFRIIPVTIHGTNRSVHTFAFLDEGSDLTLVEDDLATSIGVTGTPHPLCLRWTGDTSRLEKGSKRITIEISGMGESKRHKLEDVRTVRNLGLPCQSFQMDVAAKLHPHLKGLPVSSYQNAIPKILIGIDNLRLALPLKTREGKEFAPVAVKTRLGWCVYGPRATAVHESQLPRLWLC